MSVLLYESIAFGISIIAFIYGMSCIYGSKTPIYFKLIVSAVGCYCLEELWVVVNAVCGVENDTFSIRLIGIIGCYCTFLTASSRGLKILLGENVLNSKKERCLAFIAPIIAVAAFIVSSLTMDKSHSVILFFILLPLAVDSYYELKSLLIPMDEKGLLKQIKTINILVLLEYGISISYVFIHELDILLIMDVVSAVGMASIVWFSRKGAEKWKAYI